MLEIPDSMTRDVPVIRPDASLQRAAQVTDELDGHVAAARQRTCDPSMPERSTS